MIGEPEAEGSGAARSASDSVEAGTLMEVTFQKNPRQKYKYLEAEPKILGVTEIALAFFFIGWNIVLYQKALITDIIIVLACVGIIAGAVAIAAQNLHLPTLKACLGMQVVTAVAYVFCAFFTISEQSVHSSLCWHYYNYSEGIHENNICLQLERAYVQLNSLDELMETVQIVLAVTLAAYCCKVIPCCTPRSQVPVIVMAPPTAPQ